MRSFIPRTLFPAVAVILAGLCLASDASAANKPKVSSPTGTPVLAVVALKEQRITIYGPGGKLMQAAVSTGRGGYETPAGVFSILEKRREHYSNLYDDAAMPFMQRLTWSGIALHAGALPGRPASHGCIRLPHSFAGQLFDLTRVGMRVVVVPTDINPVEITHPQLFRPGPIVSEPRVTLVEHTGGDHDVMRLGAAPTDAISVRTRTWKAIAAEKAAASEAATQTATEAKMTAAKVSSEASAASKQLRMAEVTLKRAEMRLKAAERSLEHARSERATERAQKEKTKAAEVVAESQRRLETIKAEAQPKMNAVEAARAAMDAAEAAKTAAQEAAKLAQAKLAPVSVFVSRKTQRLYVRQAFQPVFDVAIAIRDPDKPIGTTILTAAQYVNDGTDLRWSALAISVRAPSRGADIGAAKGALERISIPAEAIDRINEVASPGSSLIISDEAMHPRETGKGTDFIVVMSGEPQGGLTIRPRTSNRDRDRERPYRRPRSYSPFLWW